MKKQTPADTLRRMADTYEKRNKVYGDNFKLVGKCMAGMFPNGITLRTEDDFTRWHLFELQIVKLTRFAVSGLTHPDSILDDGVYAAMVHALINEDTAPIDTNKKGRNQNGKNSRNRRRTRSR